MKIQFYWKYNIYFKLRLNELEDTFGVVEMPSIAEFNGDDFLTIKHKMQMILILSDFLSLKIQITYEN